MRSPNRRPLRRWRRAPLAAALALLPLSLALAACGSDDHDAAGDVATLRDGESAAEAADEDDGGELTEAERRELLVEHARCMREHGVEVPDPVFEGDGRVMMGIQGDKVDIEAMEAAQEACEHLMERIVGSFEPPSPEEQAERREQALAFAKCMREHGVDFPDPVFDGARTQVRAGGNALGVDPAELEEASEACAEETGGQGMVIGRAQAVSP